MKILGDRVELRSARKSWKIAGFPSTAETGCDGIFL